MNANCAWKYFALVSNAANRPCVKKKKAKKLVVVQIFYFIKSFFEVAGKAIRLRFLLSCLRNPHLNILKIYFLLEKDPDNKTFPLFGVESFTL